MSALTSLLPQGQVQRAAAQRVVIIGVKPPAMPYGSRAIRWLELDDIALHEPPAIGDSPALVVIAERALGTDPGGDCAVLRAIYPGVPIALLATERTSSEVIEACSRAGIDDCIVGMLTPEAITARLEVLELGPHRIAPPATGPRATRVVAIAGDHSPRQRRLGDLLAHSGYHVLHLLDTPADAHAASRVDLLVVFSTGGDGGKPVSVLDSIRAARRAGGSRLTAALGGPRADDLKVLIISGAPSSSDAKFPGAFELYDAGATPEQLLGSIDALLNRNASLLRASARVPFFCPIEFREAGGKTPGAWLSGMSFDVSSGGLFIKTLLPCRRGAALELVIRLTTLREELAITGVVAWANPYPARHALTYPVGMGVHFLGAVSDRLASLIELCRAAAATEPTSL